MALVLGVSASSQTDADPFAAAERRFTLLPAAETGVTFTNVLPENPVMNGFVYEYYYPWYGRTLMAWELPSLLRRFPTHSAFARAALHEILGEQEVRAARRFEVSTLATVVLENAGDGRFEARPLPRTAQLSPVTGIVAADLAGNGGLDLVLAGSMHELDSYIPKLDGGVGLLLRGDGAGAFDPVVPSESGLLLQGQVRRPAAVTLRQARRVVR